MPTGRSLESTGNLEVSPSNVDLDSVKGIRHGVQGSQLFIMKRYFSCVLSVKFSLSALYWAIFTIVKISVRTHNEKLFNAFYVRNYHWDHTNIITSAERGQSELSTDRGLGVCDRIFQVNNFE